MPNSMEYRAENGNAEGSPNAIPAAKPKFFRRMMEGTAFGRFAEKRRQAFLNSRFYEECKDIKDTLAHEDSMIIITVKRFTPAVNLYYSWRYAREINEAQKALEKSSEFLDESLRRNLQEDGGKRLESMGGALKEMGKGAAIIKGTRLAAFVQTMWLAYDMVRAYVESPPAMGFFEKISEAFKENTTVVNGFVSTAVSFLVMAGIQYAFHKKEKARKRELLAQEIRYLTDSELNDLNGILARQKNRACARKDFDEKIAAPLFQRCNEVAGEFVDRLELGGAYVILEKAKKARLCGDENGFTTQMRRFLGELMWHGRFSRVEAVAHASGVNGPVLAEIAAVQATAAQNGGNTEIASRIRAHYGV
ncbi:Uncharacterised protein [uncultured archaeon]|nr:Uncharacterised protein [uncultured archaeon]